MRSKTAVLFLVCLGGALVCCVLGASVVSGVSPSIGISTPSFSLSVGDGRYTLHAENAKLAEVLGKVSEVSGIQIQVDPGLTETVSADVQGVTLEELLQAVTRSQAMVFEREGTGYRLVQTLVTSQQKEIAKAKAAATRSADEDAALAARGVLTNSKKPVRDLLQKDSKAILLQNAMIDTEAAMANGKSVDVPADFRAPEDSCYYIVQFDHAVSSADREQLERAGATVSHYVPHFAYAVHALPAQIAAIRAIQGVALIEPYHPYYKLSSAVLSYTRGTADAQTTKTVTNGVFNIMTFRGAEAKQSLERVGAKVLSEDSTDGRSVLTVQADPSALKAIARVDEVQWVEPRVECRAMNDLGTKRLATPTLKALHPTLKGDGVVVNVTDSGIDFLNPGFAVDQSLPTTTNVNTRILYYEARPGMYTEGLPGDVNGHGTHVCGSILGNGALSATVVKSPGSGVAPYGTNQFAGVAPGAKVVMLEDFNSFSYAEQAQVAYSKGARLSNNSWGNSVYEYGTSSAAWDSLVRDADSTIAGNQEYIVFFAAGNAGDGSQDGTGGKAGTIGQPGNAKNVITVGAVEQPRFADNITHITKTTGTNTVELNSRAETDSDWQIAEYSSRGPVTTTDKRVKPDIVAPGSYVLSIQSHETHPDDVRDGELNRDYRYGNVDSGTNFAFFSGTSMATPLAAGGGALIYQYYTNAYSKAPSPAMMKAMMVNGAQMLNSLLYRYPMSDNDVTIVDQGWGLLDVERAIDGMRVHSSDSVTCLDEDQTAPLSTGEWFSRQIQVNKGEGGLKITLAWIDPAGTPGNALQLVNDIDLVVYGPGGGYVGNQFAGDGVHSLKFSNPSPSYGDEFNNVENVVVSDPEPGTYTIRVYGWNVAQGPQDYALVIMKGIGIEQRTSGNMPAVALDSNNAPVIAFSDLVNQGATNLWRQIKVKKWAGPIGDLSGLGTWKRLDNQWYDIRDSMSAAGIDMTLENSEEPSIAVNGENIFVSWTEKYRPPEQINHIFLKQYNGSDWVELANSGRGNGVSGLANYDAAKSIVRVDSNGYPVVAWKRTLSDSAGERVFVARWNGTNWVGYAGSNTNGVPTNGGTYGLVGTPCLAIDSSGMPVVAWDDTTVQAIQVRRWNGTSWADLGNQGLTPFADSPSLAAGPNGTLYVAWMQLYGANPLPYLSQQVYASRYSGGSWSAMGSSETFPGISASTNLYPSVPAIGVSPQGTVYVTWQAGSSNENSILARQFNGTAWVGVGGSETEPGLALPMGISMYPAIVVDKVNLPTVVFQNAWDVTLPSNTEVVAYSLIGDREPPLFAGLQRAIGGTNNNVQLFWTNAVDNVSSSILYRIYRGTSSWVCGTAPACSESDVFANPIATVTNLLTYTATGLVSNRSYCFAVRAAGTNGPFDANTVILSAAAVSGTGDNDSDCLNNAVEIATGTDACNPDTDGDGMRDGWEWFYSTNNPAHTNALSMDPLDNGAINFRNYDVGDTNQLPSADPDQDGASSYEEYQWYIAHTSACVTVATNLVSPDPTSADTDADGMPDGWEIINGLNPTDPTDAVNDLDHDGLSNLLEYQWASDPRTTDSDSDGLSDGNEGTNYLTNPSVPDTDMDGLDDSYEIALGSNPRNADGAAHGIGDGDMLQLGWSVTAGYDVLHTLLKESFETSTRTNWTHRAINAAYPYDLWHLSRAEPLPNASGVVYLNDHTTNTVYGYSTDSSFGTNWNVGYNRGQQRAALESPRITNAVAVSNLFVMWNEWFATEQNADYVQVFGRSGSDTNWYPVTEAQSGVSGISNAVTNAVGIWLHRVADISRFAGQSNVQVRFLFSSDDVNNYFPGWYVDDVTIYEGVSVRGWVRDNNGAPVQGAVVRAIGRSQVTNVIDGHRFFLPGKVFGEVETAEDGSYRLAGLPLGRYYLKAFESRHQAEFYNGALYTNGYAFGHQLNPGVPSVDLATNGRVDLSATGALSYCDFELDPGKSRAYLGVAIQSAATNVPCYLDGLTTTAQARVWNGSTGSVTAGFVAYRFSTNTNLQVNHPDWTSNVVPPSCLGDAAPGQHVIYAGTNLPFFSLPTVDLQEGESVLLALGTNGANAFLDVTSAGSSGYPLMIDGRSVTNRTPARLTVFAGTHEVRLVPTNGAVVAPRIAFVGAGARTIVAFSTNDISGAAGCLTVLTRDINGNVVTGAQVGIDGLWSTPGASNAWITPITITDLKPGQHDLVVRMPGYRPSEQRRASTFSNVTNTEMIILVDSDEDYDLVGDRTETIGYTNIFLYARYSDPDLDGLNNLFEYDQFRYFNIRLNPFSADTDADRMPDGAEVGYDGITNLLAVSRLATNTVQGASEVRVWFVGQFLAGVCNFGTGNRAISIEGDRFECSAVSNSCAPVPTVDKAYTRFLGVPTNVTSRSVTVGHNPDALVYADALPDRTDTDADGMWDGFEFAAGLDTEAKLDVIEAGRADEDPDNDSLINYEEFLGRDWTANTNDWTDPNDPDTDDDEMPDGWEMSYGLNPLNPSDGFEDPDGDSLLNVSEFFAHTSPKNPDTDADFLPDGAEVIIYGTDPLNSDTDNDGLLDGREVWDKNMDGVRDGGFFPMWAGGDLDGDGYVDGPTDWDTDGDGMPDGFEVIDEFGNLRNDPRLDPYNPYDGSQDPDGDGLSNLQEYLVRDSLYGNNRSGVTWDYSTDPFNSDSDGDGMPDGWEVNAGLHPMDPIPVPSDYTRYSNLGPDGDPDADGLWNGREYSIRFYLDGNASSSAIYSVSTDPWNPDTDGDGLQDGEEDRSFRSHPILQDADADRLMDGVAVTGKWGEVESIVRTSVYQIVQSNVTWQRASILAQIPHSNYPAIMGHLAVLTGTEYVSFLSNSLTPSITNIAIGALNRGGGIGMTNWYWWTHESFSLQDYLHFTSSAVFVSGETNYATLLGTDGAWTMITTQLVNYFAIEWDDVPVVTNHFDKALNDLWFLSWPSVEDLPHWTKISIPTNSPLPEPRWGSAVAYVPVIETKTPRDDDSDTNRLGHSTMLLDNRQLVIFGGRDGVNRFKDVWEYVVRSNLWMRSAAPLNGLPPGYTAGLSEFSALSVFVNKDTGCSCDNYSSYSCSGTDFGLPKTRPWQDSRSFDWTYLFGGWDTLHGYASGPYFYKSSDDNRSITEDLHPPLSEGVTEFVNPDPDDRLTACSLDDGATFVVGSTYIGLADCLSTNSPCTGWSALNFAGFALNDTCDQIAEALLVLRVDRKPSAALPLRIIAEIRESKRHSEPEYQSDLNTLEPSARTPSGGWFNSTPTNATIQTTSGVVIVEVTKQVQEVLRNSAGWDSTYLGWVFNATGSTTYASIDTTNSFLRVSYKPAYKVQPAWKSPSVIEQIYYTATMGSRKSVALAYDYKRQRALLFGGINGRVVLGDTREAEFKWSGGGDPDKITWREIRTQVSPSPRWGHSMVYDAKNERIMLFGGFDANHKPLNDLWIYTPYTEAQVTRTNAEGSNVTITVTNYAAWTEVTAFRNTERPQPRGGAMMAYFGDYDYSRAISDYCVGGNHQKIVLFGGTDGNTYFDDTWVLDDSAPAGASNTNRTRWILVNPVGGQSQGPSPRAFASMVWAQNGGSAPDPVGYSDFTRHTVSPSPCAIPGIFLFGGRVGTIPTGADTDQDLVDDGTEYELGGPNAGRDPRINRLFEPAQTNETIPFGYNKIGPMPIAGDVFSRGALASMESLRNDDGIYAGGYGLPYENHVQPDAVVHVLAEGLEIGVSAHRADQKDLWYHRFGGEDPFDARDVWELGVPDGTAIASNGAPAYAYSGRWCWGTSLHSTYPNDAIMELYSPLISLKIPAENGTATNLNSYFLVFHEWLDLSDSNDVVRVDAVRPETPADINTRSTGINKPALPVLANRNASYNTRGHWRRVVVPLDTVNNESNLYFRFTLQSDSNGVAGGWYIDDVSILQGSQIAGALTNAAGVDVSLYGQNYNGHVLDTTVTDGNGAFMFGLLPLGNYVYGAVSTSYGPIVLTPTNTAYDAGSQYIAPVAFTDITGTPRVVTWPAVPGITYQLQYAYSIFGPWFDLATVTASGAIENYSDWSGDSARFYRILLLP